MSKNAAIDRLFPSRKKHQKPTDAKARSEFVQAYNGLNMKGNVLGIQTSKQGSRVRPEEEEAE